MMRWISRSVVLGVLFSGIVSAKESVLVVYPENEVPLQPIYEAVMTGIEHQVGHTEQLAVPADSQNIQELLKPYHPDHIIALGKSATEAISHSGNQAQLRVGMLAFKPPDYLGVSLTLDSSHLAQKLKQLAPFIKRVYAVQDTRHPAVSANKATKPDTPEIVIREGEDMIATIRLLGHLVEEEATTSDAVLMPANLPNNILYEIARIAWDRHIILLSTNLYHLENGALLVLYPDPIALGEQLGSQITNKKVVSENLQSVNAALNKLIARHLNIDFDAAMLGHFAVTIK
jgi:hypothetical protein